LPGGGTWWTSDNYSVWFNLSECGTGDVIYYCLVSVCVYEGQLQNRAGPQMHPCTSTFSKITRTDVEEKLKEQIDAAVIVV